VKKFRGTHNDQGGAGVPLGVLGSRDENPSGWGGVGEAPRRAVGAWWTPGTGWQGPGKQRKLEGAGPVGHQGGAGAG